MMVHDDINVTKKVSCFVVSFPSQVFILLSFLILFVLLIINYLKFFKIFFTRPQNLHPFYY